MADRVDYYFRQIVEQSELDAAGDGLEQADYNLAIDSDIAAVALSTEKGGILNGLTVSNSGTLDAAVATGYGYDSSGRRIYVDASKTIVLSVTGDTEIGLGGTPVGGTSTIPTSGYRRWVSLFIAFDRKLEDPRTDGSGVPVYFERNESFYFSVEKGSEAVNPTNYPDLESGKLLLADLRVTYNGGAGGVDAVSYDRRQVWLKAVNSGATPTTRADTVAGGVVNTGFPVRGLDESAGLRETIKKLLGYYNDHVRTDGNAADRHSVSDIGFAPYAYLTSTSMQAAIQELVDDLARELVTGDGPGVGHIGNVAIASGITGDTVAAGTLAAQLTSIVGHIADRLDLTAADGLQTVADGIIVNAAATTSTESIAVNATGGASSAEKSYGVKGTGGASAADHSYGGYFQAGTSHPSDANYTAYGVMAKGPASNYGDNAGIQGEGGTSTADDSFGGYFMGGTSHASFKSYGVYGIGVASQAGENIGVYGEGGASTGDNSIGVYGVAGASTSSDSYGGFFTGSTSNASYVSYGVYARGVASQAGDNIGVYGEGRTSTAGSSYGIKGEAGTSNSSFSSVGVQGNGADNSSGVSIGVYGIPGSSSTLPVGVQGWANEAGGVGGRFYGLSYAIESRAGIVFSGTAGTQNPATTTALVNELRATNVVKAWCVAELGATPTVEIGVGFASVAPAGNEIVFTLAQAVSSGTDYAVFVTLIAGGAICVDWGVERVSDTVFHLWGWDNGGGTEDIADSSFNACKVSIMVMGEHDVAA